ncbi:RnfABCDGE type electron transport complex subunit B [Halanaerobium praevalens]|uniref:Ion-translocating oxidoreductase complex subunit B n=1 Tax=Halanaerobium praevalens (strain ATCC 33744 / DSM 2228 / GSL) TaxID=572479 RepID=E3DMG9_HALPG|nr:RnfABCDGE type electron transport complex subunit B [Halanaerobium praevalens]ADO77377.1 electron transport complex, RnfABCDGE type, B subunit [Halanaerobium praevalens DSM 2228]
MNPTYLYSLVSMGGIAAVLAAGLGFASERFKVEQDPRVGKVEDALPGVNCGACGYAGCSAFAEAVAAGEAPVNGCPVGGDKVAAEVAEIMGADSDDSGDKLVAELLCAGGIKETAKSGKYQGIQTCKAANAVNGGEKSCQYSCLGFGDCESVCPFDAIYMSENGLPQIDPEKCTACGKCITECPRNILLLAPMSAQNHIRCSSHNSGKIVRKSCEVGCIACSLCAKVCPVDAIEIKDNLAVIDYEKCVNCGKCAEKCPTGTIQFEGKMIEKVEINDNCVGCTLCARACPVEAIEGEVKNRHQIDQDKCIQCGLCFEACNVKAVDVFYQD